MNFLFLVHSEVSVNFIAEFFDSLTPDAISVHFPLWKTVADLTTCISKYVTYHKIVDHLEVYSQDTDKSFRRLSTVHSLSLSNSL